MLDKHSNKTVKTICEWHSKFVHEIRLPPIRETASIVDFYENESVMVEPTTKEFRPVFEKMLKRYFDQYQKKN